MFRKSFNTLFVVAVVTAAVTVLANAAILRLAEEHIAESAEAAPGARVAVVLGAKVHPNDSLSAVLSDRMKTAVELYRSKKVSKLLLSGDHGRARYDEVNNMRRFALDHGVAPKDIFMDHAGFDTYDSMYRARDVFGVKKALVVTQRFHLARAIYTARKLGIEATGVPSDKRRYAKALLFDSREILSRTKAYLELELFRPKPKLLGPKIDIGGDGRVTWDKPD
ncbi:MAG: hypothetical protein C4521_10070 [Actinobacteria bacterium]|nr:MAG: hypothetical protein C4521_10070 [Actinomycetota bacterium]